MCMKTRHRAGSHRSSGQPLKNLPNRRARLPTDPPPGPTRTTRAPDRRTQDAHVAATAHRQVRKRYAADIRASVAALNAAEWCDGSGPSIGGQCFEDSPPQQFVLLTVPKRSVRRSNDHLAAHHLLFRLELVRGEIYIRTIR